ncbi:MAG TPA: transposase [Burkholderiales bacterium]
MPRPLRTHAPGVPLHLVQRGHNREACFLDEADRRTYRAALDFYAAETRCAVHAYVLMGNHVHLLLTPGVENGASLLMQSLGRHYVRHFNDVHARSGTLWEGRFRSMPIHAARYLLACMRYIELNPVRAGLVPHPAAWRWSSFRVNALGANDEVVTPHPLWYGLGRDPQARRAAYLALFEGRIDEPELKTLRAGRPRGRPRSKKGSDPFFGVPPAP